MQGSSLVLIGEGYAMYIGKIVKSDSHINYVCQIYGPREVEMEPSPADYAFGRFVRIAVRAEQDDTHDAKVIYALGKSTEPQTYAVGVIYDTILLNPAFGSLGPRLSNETQVELFSPDYISEKAVLIYVMVLGIIAQRNSLLPMVTLRIIDQLERLFPQNLPLLSIVKRNFAWRLKVETTG